MSVLIVNELNISDARTLKHKAGVDEWIKYLEDNGFEELGRGKFSSVYHKNDANLVVRVSKDDAWLKFYEFAYKNQRKNKHLPRIGKLIQSNDGWYLVFMETLYKIHIPVKVRMFLDDVIYYQDVDYTKVSHYHEANEFFGYDFMQLFGFLFNNKRTASWDLHGANVMKRKNDDFVIIDPYFYSKNMGSGNDSSS